MEISPTPELGERASNASRDLLPEKSKRLYMIVYAQFETWYEI